MPQMEEMVCKTFLAVKKSIDPNRRKYTFELFGFDFILDEDFNMWLIEVNTNPCLEESSKLLKSLMPRMIEDMMMLTVDQTFPKTALKRYKLPRALASGKLENKIDSNKLTPEKLRELDQIKEEPPSALFPHTHRSIESQEKLRTPDVKVKLSKTEQSATKSCEYSESKSLKSDRSNKEADEAIEVEEVPDQIKQGRVHPVEGYPDLESMWNKVCNLQ